MSATALNSVVRPSSIAVVNQGTIQADVGGGTITVYEDDTNRERPRTLSATNGGDAFAASSNFTPG